MYGKKLKIGNIMNAINSCTEMNFQKRITILLDIICDEKGLDFEKVQPSNGDAKNDGWISGKNIYFASYSPNDANISQNNQIVKKLNDDLDGLCNQVYNNQRWGKEIQEFYLIVNTHDKDLPADPDRLKELKIKEIKNKYNVEFKANVITTNQIKKYLLTEDDVIISKIADNLDIETIINDFSVIDVLDFIDDYCNYLSSTEVYKPNIDNLKITTIKKIEINQLTTIKEHILSLISASDKIDQYVSYILREGMDLDKYNKLKDYIINEYKLLEPMYSGEELYGKLMDKLIYNSMITSQVKILEAFVINIFIRCDIFKKE